MENGPPIDPIANVFEGKVCQRALPDYYRGSLRLGANHSLFAPPESPFGPKSVTMALPTLNLDHFSPY